MIKNAKDAGMSRLETFTHIMSQAAAERLLTGLEAEFDTGELLEMAPCMIDALDQAIAECATRGQPSCTSFMAECEEALKRHDEQKRLGSRGKSRAPG